MSKKPPVDIAAASRRDEERVLERARNLAADDFTRTAQRIREVAEDIHDQRDSARNRNNR